MNDQRFDEKALTSSLRLLAEEMEGQGAPPELEQKLREAFRARTAATAAAKSYRPYWLVAVAAVLLIVIGVVALRLRTDQPRPQIADSTVPQQIQEAPKTQELPEKEEVAVKPAAPRRRSVRRAPRSEVANHVNREIATDFMPLGYLNPAALQDGGQIVRVELPRSTLVNFGLPVNMDRYNEKVKADVLLGVDGMARAIRFVQ
jgi:hypothetical protein